MKWEIVIGLETHAQLATRSKIFSGASTAFGAEPNTQASPIDLALPGVLPVTNRAAVEHAIRFGLAVGATIAPRSIFARKNYFYPDLPKGYQISQFEIPVVQGGGLAIAWKDDAVGGGATGKQGTAGGSADGQGGRVHERFVRLTRAHLEEDAGKSLHEDFHGMTGIDLNRAGTPLLEIVTEPDMRSAKEAVAYARALHALVVWLGICDGNMQEGSFRCDANVSVRPFGQAEYGTRCEIKNLNSFRFLERAIDFEVQRQIELVEDGGRVVQETRLYDPDRDETRSMRSKEDAHDYRYFPDPDLPPLVIGEDWIAEVRAALPELPADIRRRFVDDYGLSSYDAATLTASREMAAYYDAVVNALAPSAAAGEGSAEDGAATPSDRNIAAKAAANWVMVDLAAALNRDDLEIGDSRVAPVQLAGMIRRILDGTISGKIARDVFAAMWAEPAEGDDLADRIIEARGLKQISDTGAIEKIVDEVLAANQKSIDEYRAGRDKAFNALVGQVMKASKGKANPQQVNALLKARLGEPGGTG
ncbi:MAG TPA: Asp-tRNA(Asn)/Glu-tRNA(Gln) amidotransferase subunit GatB [Burkholderiaceae bacterium]|nr:Asp-tRNA(Asn)/Glu-tRNA(Gln) amidotransferase subunit GatB [Burkholderiaceae bacterium]